MNNRTFSTLMITVLLTLFFTAPAFANEMRIATGGADGFYHNGLYSIFNSKIARFSDGEIEPEYAREEGTDGTLHNISLVEKGEADVAFVQLGGVVTSGANVKIVGIVMYELAHLIVPKKGKVGDVGDLEKKKGYSMGLNSRSGAAVTWKVFGKVDKDYLRTQPADYEDSTEAFSDISAGNLDSYFFVSGPRTETTKWAAQSGFKFANVWDGDFDDYKYNGQQLYRKVKVGKKEGYPNKFATVAVPAVVIANKKWLRENKGMFKLLYKATMETNNVVKSAKKLNYYPK